MGKHLMLCMSCYLDIVQIGEYEGFIEVEATRNNIFRILISKSEIDCKRGGIGCIGKSGDMYVNDKKTLRFTYPSIHSSVKMATRKSQKIVSMIIVIVSLSAKKRSRNP